MRDFVLETEQVVPRPLPEVFAFFSDASNLQRLTPDSVHFQILTPMPIEMKPGAIIDYRIRLSGFPVRWRTRINEWNPHASAPSFVDEQLRGPYRKWVHLHTFESIPGGTRLRDRVVYAVPGGPGLERMVEKLFVRPQLERIFAYRRGVIQRVFGDAALAPGHAGAARGFSSAGASIA